MKTRASFWRSRLRASGIHLGISLTIAVQAALLIFALWYPYPYREGSGGVELFLIVITVDVILGPLITLAVFDHKKPRGVLVRDLSIVGLIQLAALAYGLWTVCMARPVHLAFEFDRFRVVHAAEIPVDILDKTPVGIQALPLTGPTVLAVRPFKDSMEDANATWLALQGLQLSSRPDLWQDYAQAQMRVLAAASPLSVLKQRFPQQTALIDSAVTQTGIKEDALKSLPMVARKSFWTVLVDANSAEIRGFIPLDSF